MINIKSKKKHSVYSFISCINYFVKSKKFIIYFPAELKQIIFFLNMLWRCGFLFGYVIKKGIVSCVFIFLKINIYFMNALRWIFVLSKKSKFIFISYADLIWEFFKYPQTEYIVLTSFGYLTFTEIYLLKLKLGGILFCSLLS